MHAITYPSDSLALTLGHAIEEGRLGAVQATAQSLMRDWSAREGWTGRQVSFVVALLSRTPTRAGKVEAVGPYPYTRSPVPWWHDVSTIAQARRAKKKAAYLRHETRHRDANIKRWYQSGKYTVAQMASHFGMTRQGIYYIINRVLTPLLPRENVPKMAMRYVKSAFMNMSEWPFREPPPARPVDSMDVPGRVPRLRKALLAWCGLRAVRNLPDSELWREGERLNSESARPVKPGQLASVIRGICRDRSRWEPVQTPLPLDSGPGVA